MSDSQLPVAQVSLSELITPEASGIALDLNDTIDQNNQNLLDTSFTELDNTNQTHMPFYNVSSLSKSMGTDIGALKEAMTNADQGDVKWKNNEPYMSQGSTLELLYERIEQPRDCSQQALIESTINTVNLVNDLSYKEITERIENTVLSQS